MNIVNSEARKKLYNSTNKELENNLKKFIAFKKSLAKTKNKKM